MGRLTLNILLSFAQFEREVIGERIRDKFAASRKKGMWMGGFVPLGYDVKDRKLVVNEAEAATVRTIFERFAADRLGDHAGRGSCAPRASRNKRGKPIDKGYLYKLLNNRIYIGEAVHKGTPIRASTRRSSRRNSGTRAGPAFVPASCRPASGEFLAEDGVDEP